MSYVPIGPMVVPARGSYLEFYKVIQKGTTVGPVGRVPGLKIAQKSLMYKYGLWAQKSGFSEP